MAQLAVDKGELVVGDALHEVAVVRDQKQRAGPAVQQILHHGQHIGVQIVSRLVEDEHVRLVQQDEHERQPPPLPARQIAHRLVEVGAREAQLFEQLRGRHLLAVEHRTAAVASDHLPNAVVARIGQAVKML